MAMVSINGEDRALDGPDDTVLLWGLRDMAGLTGTKYGCGTGLCGACTVHVDGKAVKSCQITVGEVAGSSVTTIEGLDANGDHPVQVAWREANVPQCGFCQSGQIMQAASLLAENPRPTDEQILQGMSDNICRCGCYERIVSAVRLAATGA